MRDPGAFGVGIAKERREAGGVDIPRVAPCLVHDDGPRINVERTSVIRRGPSFDGIEKSAGVAL